jgi:hypothetical protein
LKRIFDNQRSDLFDLAMNATSDFVAKALVIYADDPNFKQKVTAESPDKRQWSLDLIQTNTYPHRRGEIESCEADLQTKSFVTLWSRDSMKITVKACQLVQTRIAL